ncbi:MAG: TIGR00304 family membrane protein [Pyrobaculum sp.]
MRYKKNIEFERPRRRHGAASFLVKFLYLSVERGVIELVALALLFIGVVLLMLSLLFSTRGGRAESEAGGVLIIGPVPIVFGTSQRIALAVMTLAVLLTALALLLFLINVR